MDKAKQDELKKAAAKKAAELVHDEMILGVGTGSTVKFFIDELGKLKEEAGLHLKAVVTTSSRSQKQLEGLGFKVSPLADVDQVDLTVDGADRVDSQLNGIKGGGAALTLEKNVAVNSKKTFGSWTKARWWTTSAALPCQSKFCQFPASRPSAALRLKA